MRVVATHLKAKVCAVQITSKFAQRSGVPDLGHADNSTGHATAASKDASYANRESVISVSDTAKNAHFVTYLVGESQSSRLYPPRGPFLRRKMKCSSATMTIKNAVQ